MMMSYLLHNWHKKASSPQDCVYTLPITTSYALALYLTLQVFEHIMTFCFLSLTYAILSIELSPSCLFQAKSTLIHVISFVKGLICSFSGCSQLCTTMHSESEVTLIWYAYSVHYFMYFYIVIISLHDYNFYWLWLTWGRC